MRTQQELHSLLSALQKKTSKNPDYKPTADEVTLIREAAKKVDELDGTPNASELVEYIIKVEGLPG